MEPFPVKQPKRHLLNKLPFSVTISFCPACGRGDDGTNMVECENARTGVVSHHSTKNKSGIVRLVRHYYYIIMPIY